MWAVVWVLFLFRSLQLPQNLVSLTQSLLSPQTLSLEAPARIKNKAPSPDWPQEGEVTFENAEMRYQENLPLVLKKVSFTIKPKEKIGIVGRTGSGKSMQRPLGKCLNLSELSLGSVICCVLNITLIASKQLCINGISEANFLSVFSTLFL